jgi:hypothetical protein
MYSSHSATPTESPAGAVSVLAVVLAAVVLAGAVFVATAVFDLFAAVLAAVFVPAPPQAAMMNAVAQTTAPIKNALVLDFMLFFLFLLILFGVSLPADDLADSRGSKASPIL